MANIILEIEESLEAAKEIEACSDAKIVSSDRFDGDTLLQALVALTSTSIPIIAKIIIENIRAKKHVIIKSKGIEIKGLDANNAIKVLEELSKDD